MPAFGKRIGLIHDIGLSVSRAILPRGEDEMKN